MMPVRDIIDSWASIYANSAPLRSSIAFAHVAGLLSGGGAAIAADLATLKALRRNTDALRLELDRVHDSHRLVVGSLVIVTISGILLTAADVDAYFASTAFWIKMGLVVALAINGAVMMSVSTGTQQGGSPPRMRVWVVSIFSLVLWFATTFLGAVVPNAL
jgi:uncharacterized membrane protein